MAGQDKGKTNPIAQQKINPEISGCDLSRNSESAPPAVLVPTATATSRKMTKRSRAAAYLALPLLGALASPAAADPTDYIAVPTASILKPGQLNLELVQTAKHFDADGRENATSFLLSLASPTGSKPGSISTVLAMMR
jgi:hypothetical protein